MKAYSLPQSDTLSLLRLVNGPRQVSEVVVREVQTGRYTLTSLGLATLEGDVLTITDKGRTWCEPTENSF